MYRILTSSDSLHDLPSRLQALTPVVLPLKKVTRVQSVRPQFKHTAEFPRRRGGPKAELLHQAGALRVDELLELAVEFGELWVVLDGIERLVVAGVTLVLPDVAEGVAVADFGAPGADQVDLFVAVSDTVPPWTS